MKQKKPGESYRALVTIVKINKGVPTAVMISGKIYTLRSPDQHLGGERR